MSLLIGSHTSISGGYFKAVEAAAKFGMKTCQIFTKNSNQWRSKSITDSDVEQFDLSVKANEFVKIISHTSYLINLASPKEDLWDKSVEALADEWQRAERLHLDGLVMHPGSATDGDALAGIARIVAGVKKAHSIANPKSSILLFENTAGQGTALGWKIDQLAAIFDSLERPHYIGICLDSCHAHAAGYDLSTIDGTELLVEAFSKHSLLGSIRAIHLNDSKKPAGSRVDRHEHLGFGTITEEGLSRFISHPAFRNLPMYLETEKEVDSNGRDWDEINMETALKLYKGS